MRITVSTLYLSILQEKFVNTVSTGPRKAPSMFAHSSSAKVVQVFCLLTVRYIYFRFYFEFVIIINHSELFLVDDAWSHIQ